MTVLTKNGHLRLIAAYRPPTREFHTTDLDNIFTATTPTLLAGNLNCKHTQWNCRRNNPAGAKLQSYAARNDLIVDGPTEPTHVHTNGIPDILDIVIAKNTPWHIEQRVYNDLDFDHNPVVITLDGADTNEPPHRFSISWPAFTERLNSTLESKKKSTTKCTGPT